MMPCPRLKGKRGVTLYDRAALASAVTGVPWSVLEDRKLPGPTLILACPKCSAPHRLATLESGNTFDAEMWSDGKMRAPMPDQLEFKVPRLLMLLLGQGHDAGRFISSRGRKTPGSVLI